MLPIEVRGLSVVLPEWAASRYFTYNGTVFIPWKRKSIRTPVHLGVKVDGGWAIGWGGILFLKANNPEFASRLQMVGFPTAQYWRPLNLDLVREMPNGQTWLDPQWGALKACAHHMVGNVVAGVGIGKTNILAALAKASLADHHNVLVTGPTQKVRDQLLKSLRDEWDIPRVVDYKRVRGTIPDKPTVVVANLSAFVKDCKEGKSAGIEETFGTMLVDEAHNFYRESWSESLLFLPGLYRLFGLSGTSVPTSADNKSSLFFLPEKVAAAVVTCGPVIYRVSPEEHQKYIDVPTVVTIPYNWSVKSAAPVEGNNDCVGVRRLRRHNHDRAVFLVSIVRALNACGRTTVVALEETEFITTVMGILNDKKSIRWFGGNTIHDNSGKPLRPKEAEDGLASGKYRVVFATSHLSEGWNVPSLNAILMSEGKDASVTQQRSGRVVRKSSVQPVVINVVDSPGILNHHAQQRTTAVCQYYKIKGVKVNSVSELQKLVSGLSGGI